MTRKRVLSDGHVLLAIFAGIFGAVAQVAAGNCDDQPGAKWDPLHRSCVNPPEQCFYLRTLWQGEEKVLTAGHDGSMRLEERVEGSPHQVWYVDPTGQQKWVKLMAIAKPGEAVDFSELAGEPQLSATGDNGDAQMVKFQYNGRYEYIYPKSAGSRFAMDVVHVDDEYQPVLRKKGSFAGQYWMRESASCDQAQRMLSAMQ